MSFFVWVMVRGLMGNGPFVLDPPEIAEGTELNAKQRAFNMLRWFVYAVIWLNIIAFAFLTPVGISLANTDIPDWMALAAFSLVMATWAVVLWKRVSLKWPFMGVVLSAIATGGFVINVVTATGVGKLMIMTFGRANVFTPSRLRAETRRVRPRGLVEEFDND